MTKYTAEDFARAGVAYRPPMQNVANEHQFALLVFPNGYDCWSIVRDGRVDSGRVSVEWLMASGWRPLYDKNDLPRGTESLTAREHLEKVWEKSHEADVIPAGAGHITKWDDGDYLMVPEGARYEMSSRGSGWERRLLDPSPAPAWHNARIIEAWHDDNRDTARWARADNGTWLCLATHHYPTEAKASELHDVTVIVGADDDQTKGQDR